MVAITAIHPCNCKKGGVAGGVKEVFAYHLPSLNPTKQWRYKTRREEGRSVTP